MNPELKAQLIGAAAEAILKDEDQHREANHDTGYTVDKAAAAAVEAVLAALTLRSVHELDAQPAGAVVTDFDGDPWQKTEDGSWIGEASTLREANTESSLQLEAWAPLHLAPQTGGRL